MRIARNGLVSSIPLAILTLIVILASLYAVQASISQPSNALANPEIVVDVAQSLAEIYTVTGQVTGPDGPMEDIQVFFDCCATDWSVRTDANGVYTFTTEGPQTASIIVAPPLTSRLGQAARLLNIVGDMSDVNFHLEPGNMLAGRVINQNGRPGNLDHDLYNSQGAKQWLPFNENAEFAVFLPPDEYTLLIGPPCLPWEDHTVDLRTGDVPFWEVVIDVADEYLPLPPNVATEPPPLIERISVGTPNADDMVHIVGAAGAITDGIPYLEVINLHTGSFTTTAVMADGSFEADILAPYGSALQLRYNKWRNEYNRSSGTGAILWVYPPDTTTQADEIPVYLLGRAGDYRGHWTATGSINDSQFNPGDPFAAALDIAITGPRVDDRFDSGDYKLVALLNLERFFDASGQHHARVQRGTSTSFTATGLPIDSMSSNRRQNYTPLTLWQEVIIQAAHRTSDTLNLTVNLTGTLPFTMPQGLYRPALVLLLGPDQWQSPLAGNSILCSEDSFDHRAELGFDENLFANYLPVMRLGSPNPPRLPWALLVNVFSNGVRGTIAHEEQGLVGLSNRIAFQTERLVIPPRSRWGQAIPYRLEPFIPTLASSLASDVEPYPPIIPLKFPGGELNVTVVRPDGSSDHLGSAPFCQARNGMEGGRYSYYIGGDRTLEKVYEVTTLSDQFVYEFE